MIRRMVTATLAGAVLLTAGCSGLPRGAALQSEIRPSKGETEDYAFYPVTRAFLPTVEQWPAVGALASDGWPRATEGSLGQIIKPGDRVSVVIWDSSENSLLTGLDQRQAPLGEMQVSPDGRVFIPYVGEVRISGMSPQRAREAIESQLTEIAPSSQVQIALSEGTENSVAVAAGVGAPGVFPLRDRSTNVLTLLSQAGGVAPTLRNPRIRLQRGAQNYAIALDRIYENPTANALVQGGDTIIVEEDERYFIALGAAGKEDIIPFRDERVTALEAIAMIGGLTDTRADPQGVLVLREYPRSALAAGLRGPREDRVVFAIDLTSADGLFSAKNFQIMPGDLVLATESPVSSIQVALSLLGGGVGFARQLTN
ncbi:polysaccharide biosynthesis/export family protein [Palleronia sp. LCG004]|uniref:polysaccharide biosynthesis/export family protein n=1 Tax=Palleronia sp. LCG004 TaxID=3079304 RepID=UPI0029425223|nr:polysaccharide biosynthesis/export family protein [Palleronia sp. LCG004]WOI57367.1 polysaccharide biosynthesis/export family protein [Palleronia sp. LCG004]